MQFLMIDGQGAPEGPAYIEAVGWLYAAAYPIEFASKVELDEDYVVPPLEGLWWSEDLSAFISGVRDSWQWTMMIMQPARETESIFEKGLAKAEAKLGDTPSSLRLETFAEGLSVQILHVGPYADEAPTRKGRSVHSTTGTSCTVRVI